jgi:hypothetical protein
MPKPYLTLASDMVAKAVAAKVESAESRLSWVEVTMAAMTASTEFAKKFDDAGKVAGFVAENPEIMSEIQRHISPSREPLWVLVKGNIASFVRDRLSETTDALYASQFDNDFDPVENMRKFGREVANAWEEGAGEDPMVKGQIAMLREQLEADDLRSAIGSLSRTALYGGFLRTRFADPFQDACDAWAKRAAFIGRDEGNSLKM